HVHGRGHDRTAGVGDPVRAHAGVLGGEVDRPRGASGRVVGRPDPADLLAVLEQHAVAARVWAEILDRPAEELAVERPGGGDVAGAEIHPVRRARRKRGSHAAIVARPTRTEWRNEEVAPAGAGATRDGETEL